MRCRVSPLQTRFLRGPQDRLFCFGKSTQNHFRPCAASPRSLRHHPESRWLRNSLRSNSPRRAVDSGRQRSRARRREDTQETHQIFPLGANPLKTQYSCLTPNTALPNLGTMCHGGFDEVPQRNGFSTRMIFISGFLLF